MSKAVYAAGALCWRVTDGKIRILVIHRTKYADITLPKGKVDPGESLPQTAVREVREETGLGITLGVPLGVSRYPLPSGREKVVHYWIAKVSEKAIRESTFVPNSEVAALEWVTLKKARSYLSFAHDVDLVNVFADLVEEGVTDTFSITVLRHAKAGPAGAGGDAARTLTERGIAQASAIAPMLEAFGVRRIVSSTAVRCLTTVAPLAARTGITPTHSDRISQDSFDDGIADPRTVVGKRIRSGKNSVICTHAPLVPEILREIALGTGSLTGSYLREAAGLSPAEFSVVHLSATNPASGIIAIETHSAPIPLPTAV